MWRYSQSTGELFDADGHCVGVGYSGHDTGKNNPAMQDVRNIGPIPVGEYRIGPPYDSTSHGPHVMSLTPLPATETFGRSGFLMHGDSIRASGTASHGCIIQARAVRERVSTSADSLIEVVA